MPDPRGAMHHPHPSPHGYPAYPGPGYPPSGSGPAYHRPSGRHVSNGPPPPVMVGGPPPPPMAMGGPPPEALIAPPPPSAPIGNGHAHGPPSLPNASPAVRKAREDMDSLMGKLAHANENTWMLIGAVAEQMNDQDRALSAFENALRHNPNSILGLNAVASIMRSRDNFDKAIEYFQRILNIKQDNGEVWGSMGHCLLMKDDLPKAYTAYQQALYHLPNPKEPKLWYGIGILYDRYGSFEHAEEAFTSVLKMDPNFEKANEIYFRLGIIYKHQRKYPQSLDCFRYILNNPPRPLTSWDIWFQLGHVYEQDRDYENARDAYMRVLTHQPDHAKVLQQLGWLHHQPGAPFADQDKAVSYLTKSLETDGNDAQSWYLLGRAFMAGQRYNKAYEAYQQAVYRDGRNPTFWCSIGVLYYQINQYRDALDAYSRAIRLNPYISEVWYNLGSLYESCNNQITDAIDAYSRAAELDPTNATIKQRLAMLQAASATNAPLPPAPGPVDVHPSQYSATPAGPYPPGTPPGGSPIGLPGQMPEIRQDGHPAAGRDLPPPPPGGDMGRSHSPGPFRGGAAPPPLNHVDETRGSMARHAPLAPIETERRDSPAPGPRGAATDKFRDEYFNDGRWGAPSWRGNPDGSIKPPPHMSPRSAEHMRLQQDGFEREAREREARDHEAYQRRERERRQRAGIPPDPRGPSPSIHDRAPGPPPHPMDPRRQPSPRLPPGVDYRDYPRPGDGYPYYPHERGYPPGPDPRDRDRERYDSRREDERRRYEEREREFKPDTINGLHHPSITREFRPDDPRAPSPAPSTGSRAGGKRGRESEGVKPPSLNKKAKEDLRDREKEKSISRKGDTTPKSTTSKDKASRNGDGSERDLASSPAASAMGGTPVQTPQQPPPARTVDEDYDEGAADALMFLHGDRPAPTNGSAPAPISASPSNHSISPRVEDEPSVLSQVGNKRTDPPSPVSPQSQAKKSRSADDTAGSPQHPAGSPPRGRTVIEVLNAANVTPPVPTPSITSEDIAEKDAVPVRVNAVPIEALVAGEKGDEVTAPAAPAAAAEAAIVDSVARNEQKKAEDGDVEMSEPELGSPPAVSSHASEHLAGAEGAVAEIAASNGDGYQE